MIEGWKLGLLLAGLVAAMVNAGAFFAFSNFVMPALDTLSDREAVRAMQAINRAAPTPTFVACILGAGLVGVPILLAARDDLARGPMLWLAVGVALSLLSFAITMTLNVPRNNALERVDAAGAETAARWANYLKTWTLANTARGLASTASAIAYALALRG